MAKAYNSVFNVSGGSSQAISVDSDGSTVITKLVLLDEKTGNKWQIKISDGELIAEPLELEDKREIKLNSILDDKKVEFTLDITGHAHGVMYVNVIVDDFDDFDVLKKASAVIKFMKFILKGNKILELEISIKTLDTEWGKIIKELIDSGVDLELKQGMVNNQVKSFYFKYPKMSA